MPKLYTTQEAAEMLGINVTRVQQLVGNGIGTRYGRDWMLTLKDIRALRHRRTKPGPVPRKEAMP